MAYPAISASMIQSVERDIGILTVEKLKSVLRHQGLPVSGNKSVLVGRVRDGQYLCTFALLVNMLTDHDQKFGSYHKPTLALPSTTYEEPYRTRTSHYRHTLPALHRHTRQALSTRRQDSAHQLITVGHLLLMPHQHLSLALSLALK